MVLQVTRMCVQDGKPCGVCYTGHPDPCITQCCGQPASDGWEWHGEAATSGHFAHAAQPPNTTESGQGPGQCCLFPLNNLKREWLLAFWNKIQTHERFKRTLFIRTKQCEFCFKKWQLNQKQLIKGINPKICMLCFVQINNILWTFYVFGSGFHNVFINRSKSLWGCLDDCPSGVWAPLCNPLCGVLLLGICV